MIILQNFLAHFRIKNKFPTRRLLKGEGGVREGEGVWVGEGREGWGEGRGRGLGGGGGGGGGRGGERVGEGLRGELK